MIVTENDEIINYNDLYKILFDKYKATHDEIRYWLINSYKISRSQNSLEIIISDLPHLLESSRDIYYQTLCEYSDLPISPPHHFYLKSQAESFNPTSMRFVYVSDLTAKRNWYDFKIDESHTNIIETLKQANEAGILHFYDFERDIFTLHKTNPGAIKGTVPDHKKHLWCHTFDGDKYLSNPNSFFLLRDILTIERVFFNKDREACLKEIYELHGYKQDAPYPKSNDLLTPSSRWTEK